MFCKNCGKELDDNAVICTNCGVATDKLKVETAETTAKETANNLKSHNVFSIIGFVLALLTIVFMFVNAIPYFIALVAGLTLSIIGLVNSKKYKSYGKGLSIAGVCVCGAGLVFWIVVIGIYASLLATIVY